MICKLCNIEFDNLKNHIVDCHNDLLLMDSKDLYTVSDEDIINRYKRIGIWFCDISEVINSNKEQIDV